MCKLEAPPPQTAVCRTCCSWSPGTECRPSRQTSSASSPPTLSGETAAEYKDGTARSAHPHTYHHTLSHTLTPSQVESFEIDPDYISDSDSSSSSSSLLSDEPDSAPSSQQQQQQQLQQLSPTSSSNEDETTLPGIEAPPTKQRPRHSDSRAVRLGASPLFAPTSQLVSENIKVRSELLWSFYSKLENNMKRV